MNDNLINRIVYLISNYIEANEPSGLDAFLYNIINCIIEENDVKNYVNEIKILDFYEKNHSSLGKLDCDNNLCVFKKGIENDVNKIIDDTKVKQIIILKDSKVGKNKYSSKNNYI